MNLVQKLRLYGRCPSAGRFGIATAEAADEIERLQDECEKLAAKVEYLEEERREIANMRWDN